jgi:hypothetical protein
LKKFKIKPLKNSKKTLQKNPKTTHKPDRNPKKITKINLTRTSIFSNHTPLPQHASHLHRRPGAKRSLSSSSSSLTPFAVAYHNDTQDRRQRRGQRNMEANLLGNRKLKKTRERENL